MSDKLYDIVIKAVPAKLVGTVLQVLEGCGEMSMEPHLPSQKEEPKKKAFTYRGGRRYKGISAKDAIVKAIEAAGGGVTVDYLSKCLTKEYDFAPTSASAAVSELTKEGRVTRDPETGRVHLVTLTKA